MKVRSSTLVLLSLATALLSARGQVGYVNVAVTNGYNFIGNPFNASDTNGFLNNSITNVLANGSPAIPTGAAVYLWNANNQSFGAASIYSQATGWSINYDLSPGKGFALYSPSSWTLTLLGTIVSGSTTNTLPGTNKFALVASKLPMAGDFSSTGLGLPATDGESVYLFRTNSQTFSDAYSWFAGYGWFDPNQISGTNGPTVAVAQAFFVQHPGPDLNWVQASSFIAASAAQTTSFTAPAASLQNLSLRAGQVILTVANPGGGTYTVGFSADGQSWTTLATNQTSSTWISTYCGGAMGYYQVTTP